jgi:tetratricopeptide (TPR) repeat protein
MQCHAKWVRGEFEAAVKWGKEGKALQDSSNVDTQYDVTHNLALAERDSGRPEEALKVFLEGRTLADVANPRELDQERDGSYYGNIGRCLQFMGQVDRALACYQKSAFLLEKNPRYEHVLNQGFIRAWIGEALVARGQLGLADVFFRAAAAKWTLVSPPRATWATGLSQRIKTKVDQTPVAADGDAEGVCLEWIAGRSIDARFQHSKASYSS